MWAPDYRRVIGTEGVITDDLWPNVFPSLPEGRTRLHVLAKGNWKEVAIERRTSQVGGHTVLESLTAHTSPPVVWENPFRAHRFCRGEGNWASPAGEEAWFIAEAELYAGFARAIREGAPLPYSGALGRLDLEMCIATYESARRGATMDLPLREVTPHEETIHRAFRERYGREPL